MLSRFLFLFLFSAATLWSGAAAGADAVYGVEVVVIDAGHGGKFPGAHYAGVYEKDLTLKVALKLGRLIEKEMPGVKVVYTRTADKTLGSGQDLASDLQARASIANRAGGDLFISIHVNAARSSSARGAETLVMGETPKEQRYNEDALFENNREELIDMSDEREAAIVRAYIQNRQFTYGHYSMAMARCIQNNYARAGRHTRPIKAQLLRVLYATDMPSVLTEIGFLSNPQEAAYMKSEKGQNEIARSLYNAVRDYSDYVLECRRSEEEGAPDAGPDPVPAGEREPGIRSGEEPAQPEKTAAEAAGGAAESTRETGSDPVAEEPAGEREPLRYAVQVLASMKAVPLGSPEFKVYRGKVKQYASDGTFRYKYCVGEYTSRAAAQKQLATVRKTFPNAFVVCCRGSRIVAK